MVCKKNLGTVTFEDLPDQPLQNVFESSSRLRGEEGEVIVFLSFGEMPKTPKATKLWPFSALFRAGKCQN